MQTKNNKEQQKMEILTAFRSAPTTAVRPQVSGNCWACGSMQAGLERPGHAWMELTLYVEETSEYVTSEDGGAMGLGYNQQEDWYSFPSNYIVQWRWVGEESWRKGHPKYQAKLRQAQATRAEEKRAHRSRMIVNGVDYEALLAREGMGELD